MILSYGSSFNPNDNTETEMPLHEFTLNNPVTKETMKLNVFEKKSIEEGIAMGRTNIFGKDDEKADLIYVIKRFPEDRIDEEEVKFYQKEDNKGTYVHIDPKNSCW